MVNHKIAISGKARSGKNTIAEMFNKFWQHDNNKIVALADPMKAIIKIMFPEAKDENLWGASELRSLAISDKYINASNNPLTYREALIQLGAFGRKYNPNIWLNALVNDADKSNDVNAYIVADVRFINEFKYLKESGFTMIRVLRNDCVNIDDVSEKEQDEIKDSEFHYVIRNNDSLNELNSTVFDIGNKLIIDKSVQAGSLELMC